MQSEVSGALPRCPGFGPAVKRFVGPGDGPYGAIKDAGDAVVLAMGGPPDDPVRQPDGGWLFSACEAHVCLIKGALLLGPDHRIRAVALFDFVCAPAHCVNEPRLDLFLRDPADEPAQAVLTAWAERTIARDLAAFPTAAAKRLAGVQVSRAAGR